MSECYEYFSDLKKAGQLKRASNRDNSAALLTHAGVKFEAKSDGIHLIVDYVDGKIDFWPGTGLWIVRSNSQRGRGVQKLIYLVKKGQR